MKILPLVPLGLCMALLGEAAYPQTPPPITSSGLNTQISAPVNLPSGAVQHNITGGTRPGGGANLFHSFGEFGVPTNNLANFLNDAALPTTNILSRVTGGNPSNILGTIQTQGFGNANLFLMNPAGIVFGPNASLNVGGAAHFTTADYLRLADGVQFTAMPSAQDALLSVAPVAAFGFLESNPASISVEGSMLAVSEGQTLSLVGGDITIGSSGLNALGGKIAIASLASSGEVLAGTFASAPNVNGELLTTMGNISLLEGTTVDVSNDAAGTVIIRGGQLMMTDATISADTFDTPNGPLAIDIDVVGTMTITSDTVPALTAMTSGNGNAAEILIHAGALETHSSLPSDMAMIDTHSSGLGNGGNVNIVVGGDLNVNGNPSSSDFFIQAASLGSAAGGNVSIQAGNGLFEVSRISTGNFDNFAGPAGDITIASTGELAFNLVELTMESAGDKGGNLTLRGSDIQISNSGFYNVSLLGNNKVVMNADHLVLIQNTEIISDTALEPGGGVTITGQGVEFRDGGRITTQTFGDAQAGSILIQASDHVSFTDEPNSSIPSGLFTNSFGGLDLGDSGIAGDVTILAPRVEIAGGARINTTTETGGHGGNVVVMANEEFSITGEREFDVPGESLGLGGTRASGIYTRTVKSDFCGGGSSCDAGNISITTGSFTLADGAVLDSGTTGSGKGGTITATTSENFSVSGTLQNGTPGGVFSRTIGTEPGSGAGGQISLTAGQNFTLSDGASVSASSDGPGNAGNITITGHDTIIIDKATVTTEAAQASGGNIKLTANNTIQLVDSTIESTVKGDAETVAGNIELDPDFIILQNSHILAKAVDGQGGNITLIANKGVLVDAQSTLEVTSERGVSGTVNIESPIQVLSGAITPLPSTPVNVATLYAARCVAGEGGHFSTFVDSKADSVAPPPGTFLASPFLPFTSSSTAGSLGHTGTPPAGNTAFLQLAAYTPPVLFAQAVGQIASCP